MIYYNDPTAPMQIDQFKRDDGHYEIDGNFFEDAESVFCHALGFCGCGCPEVALRVVRDVLAHIAYVHAAKGNLTYSAIQDSESKLFHGVDAFRWIVLYLLDSRGLTEHGGNVSCCWLTEAGRGMLDDLNKFFCRIDSDTEPHTEH